MAFGNYYGGVTNEKNILDKLGGRNKEIREGKGMFIKTEGQAEQIKNKGNKKGKTKGDKTSN